MHSLIVAALVAATVTPANGIPATDRELTFQSDGITAYGTLHVPAHRPGARLAAALLLPGSGPTDRNGNQLPKEVRPNTLALMAGALDRDGIMTFRFDKYGSGPAHSLPPAGSDYRVFIRQADAAYATLRAQPETNPFAMLVVGHSEGGMNAMLVDTTAAPRPAGLALVAPQDQRVLDLIARWAATQFAALPPDQALAQNNLVAAWISAFRAGEPTDTTGILPLVAQLLTNLGAQGAFLRTDDAIYPPDVARRVPPGTRVLVTCGTADPDITCDSVQPLLRTLHGERLATLDGVDHFLHPAGSPLNDQSPAPAFLAALHQWARHWSR